MTKIEKALVKMGRCLEAYEALSTTNSYKKYALGIREITKMGWVNLHELIVQIENNEKNKAKKRK
jgi:hypothetical protein